METSQLINGVSAIVHMFETPLFVAFSAMIAFSVGLGIKRLMLE